ncbi:MAG: aromatic ring-hydroxylating dioxygenase subunit alpha [Acidobacteriia bacterium]|nr:aromatic ring-hydroxylating dioxygenase subunit alpha [Terriglobia bacterium]
MGSNDRLTIHSDISRAWSIPARFYVDSEVFALERERIFARAWQVVGHSDQLKNPGDFFTTELHGEPLLLVRGTQGELRGFYNVCRHRAGPPAEGCGSRKLFRCGYHGWTYGLDGALISAPEFEGAYDFKPEQFALIPVRVEEWFNLIFVNLDPKAEPLMKSLGELPKQAARFNFAGMKLFERRTYDTKCNWKTYVDNYLEGYHLPSVHPGLNRELDYNAYTVEPYARHVRQFSPIRGAQPGDATARRYQEAREDLTTDYFWIFPNWMLNCYPDNVSLNIVLPLGPERTLAIFEWYLPEKDLGSQTANDSVRFSDEIQIEDGAICETVQKNLHSRSYQRGRYSVKQEKGVHAFHRMYAEAMNNQESNRRGRRGRGE